MVGKNDLRGLGVHVERPERAAAVPAAVAHARRVLGGGRLGDQAGVPGYLPNSGQYLTTGSE